jgi:hypothetical protein
MTRARIHSLRQAAAARDERGLSRTSIAPLLLAFCQALECCPEADRERLTRELEANLDTDFDALDEKFAVLLHPNLPPRERAYSLWLLYLSLFHPSSRFETIWIGPDFAGEDQEECLRVSADFLCPELFQEIAAELALLARGVAPGLAVDAAMTGPGAGRFALREDLDTSGSTA